MGPTLPESAIVDRALPANPHPTTPFGSADQPTGDQRPEHVAEHAKVTVAPAFAARDDEPFVEAPVFKPENSDCFTPQHRGQR